jgi:indole-3-glycerol phosphate synthase
LTFKVDVESLFRLREKLPKDIVAVAESGIESRAVVKRLEQAGYNAVLVGTYLMQQQDVTAAARGLLQG